MSFVIEQKIKGHVYLYEVESYWDPEKKKPRQKRRYLGKKDEATGKAIPPRLSSTPKYALGYGAVYLLHAIAKDIGLEKLLINHFGEYAHSMLLWAYFKIIEVRAGYLFNDWCQDNLLPYQNKGLTSQALSRWMSELAQMDSQRVQFFKAWTVHQQQGHALWFDITSISSYAQQNSWCEWGYNRDGETLPQINLGMVMCVTGLPLFYQVYPGSISDVTTLGNIACLTKDWQIELDTFIVDRGFYSAANLALLKEKGLHFIMPIPATVKIAQQLLTETKSVLNSPLNSMLHQGRPIFSVVKEFQLNEKTYYAYIYFDEKRFSDESCRFYRRLNELELMIGASTFYSIEQVGEALESSWAGSSGFFEIQVTGENKASLKRKRNAITWRINRMGKMILMSDKKYEPEEILDWYRKKDCVEKLFDTLKNELDEHRMRVSKEDGMHGKLFLNFIATIIYLALLNRMKAAGLNQHMTVPELIMTLKKWRVIQFQDDTYRFTEMTKKVRTVLKSLNVQIQINPGY